MPPYHFIPTAAGTRPSQTMYVNDAENSTPRTALNTTHQIRDYVPITYNIDFTPDVKEQHQERLRELRARVESFRTWVEVKCQKSVSEMKASGKLRTMREEELFRTQSSIAIYQKLAPWLTGNITMSKSLVDTTPISLAKLSIKGFPIEEGSLRAIESMVTEGTSYKFQSTWYQFDPISETLSATIRTIICSIDRKPASWLPWKWRAATVTTTFSGQHCIFNDEAWQRVRAHAELEVDTEGAELLNGVDVKTLVVRTKIM